MGVDGTEAQTEEPTPSRRKFFRRAPRYRWFTLAIPEWFAFKILLAFRPLGSKGRGQLAVVRRADGGRTDCARSPQIAICNNHAQLVIDLIRAQPNFWGNSSLTFRGSPSHSCFKIRSFELRGHHSVALCVTLAIPVWFNFSKLYFALRFQEIYCGIKFGDVVESRCR